jgi:DNA-binding CsgD family transcriptional regulator
MPWLADLEVGAVHGFRERLARLEAKLGVQTAAEAVARALREST